MSYCKESGKDQIIFLTEEDASKPSTIEFTKPEEEQAGLIAANGDINWNCPCLGGMAVGPCGVEFREAFSCFHYSEAEPKGSDCFEKFVDMQECMKNYPELYDDKEDPMSGIEDNEEKAKEPSSSDSSKAVTTAKS